MEENREPGAFLDKKAASCRRTPRHPAALPLDADPPETACATAGVFARLFSAPRRGDLYQPRATPWDTEAQTPS